MTLKKALVITGIWTALTVIAGGLGLWYILSLPIRTSVAQARAEKLGSGIATFMCIGYACVWLPYAAKIGKEKRAQREAQRKKRKRER